MSYGKGLDNSSDTLNDSCHFLEIQFVRGVIGSVIVGIPEEGRVSNHDRRVVHLPEGPVVGPSHAGPIGGSSNAFGRETCRLTKATNSAAHQVR